MKRAVAAVAAIMMLAGIFAGCVGDVNERSGDAIGGQSEFVSGLPLYEPTWESVDAHPVPQWFDDAKFGIFIHWGLYSVPAWGPVEPNRLLVSTGQDDPYLLNYNYAEWYWTWMNIPGSPTWQHHLFTYGVNFNYDDFIPMFTAENYNPEEWVSLIKDAGAKYMVLTSKHHEGFCLFDSNYTNRTAYDLGPRRDLAGELEKAARAAGDIKFGFYYSLLEWYNPSEKYPQIFFPTNNLAGVLPGPRNPYTQLPVDYTGYEPVSDYAADYMNPQVKELVDKYHPDILWADGGWDGPSEIYWNSPSLIAYFYNQSAKLGKEVVVNDRWGLDSMSGAHGDYATPEYAQEAAIKPEKWETCEGIGRSFGYNTAETESDYKSVSRLVDDLVDIVSKNGNLLLNIGPDGTGGIPEIMRETLLGIGAWLNVNGEAIYGTRYYKTAEDAGGLVRYTQKNGTLYAIALEWPGTTLTLENATAEPGTVITMLGVEGALDWSTEGGKLVIKCPDRSEASCDYAYAFRITLPAD